MVTSGGGIGEAPREGYYPDPSIPGYVRYWNGSSWVPGTSRPAPATNVALPPPSADAAVGPAPPAPQVPAQGQPRVPSVEESGPMFLDEDPAAPVARPGPAPLPEPRTGPPAWNADPARQSAHGEDPRRVSWGSADPAASPPPTGVSPAADGSAVPREGGYGYPRTAPPATPSAPAAQGGYGYPAERALPTAPGGYGYPPAEGGVPWQRQVRDLAGEAGTARPAPGPAAAARPGPAGEGPVLPWRPPVDNPFLQAVQQSRPASTGRRLAARLIDTVLVGGAVAAAVLPLATSAVQHVQDKIDAARLSGEDVQVWLLDGTTGTCLAVALCGLLLAGLLYEVLPTVKWGRTLGKKLLRIQVLDIESQLTPGFGQALRRMLLRQLLDLVVVGAVSAAWCLFDRPWRQCWHDKAARTFVAAD